jgi:hypothetical protein
LEQTGFINVEVKNITPALWVSQSLIAYLFAKPGRKTWQLRNPFLTLLFMTTARFLAFPALCLGNLCGQGDCLQVTATKA